MTFLELAERVLKEEKKPLTADEIWQLATSKGYDKHLNSEGKTPWATLGALLHVNAKDNPKTLFARTETRPKRFYLKSQASHIDLSPEPAEEETKAVKKKNNDKEKQLHPYLAYFAYVNLKCFTKTINHSTSTKKEFGEWVHPDMVGCHFPFEEWKSEVYDLSSSIGNVSINLFSFELKSELTFGNLRESFFQSVSNSSWANESYLVAGEISNEEEFMKELTRLSSSFGIGVIKLNIEDPADPSQIILPAKNRETLDWDTIDKLTMNKDFKEFLSRVKIDITSKNVHQKEYDIVFDVETLKKKNGA